MKATFRNYPEIFGFTEDYYKVRAFLVQLNYCEYTYTRWDWMVTHPALDKNAIEKIGLWEDGDRVVGLAVFDLSLGIAFCLVADGYEMLREEVVRYAEQHLKNTNDNLYLVIPDENQEYQKIAARRGFIPTSHREYDAMLYPENTNLHYTLPEGFKVVSMAEEINLRQYCDVLWKGFDHEVNGEGPLVFGEEEEKEAHNVMYRPNVDLNLKIAILDSEGNYVAYCGMWYDEEAGFAVVEPVATVPEYRKMGLAKAAVLEGIKRTGANQVLVGSSQQFYYNIGFYPYATNTLWLKKCES